MNHSLSLVKRLQSSPTISRLHVLDRQAGIGLGLVGLALALLYHSTLGWLVQIWWNDKEYSHGFLVPLIALYLVWIKRESLTRLQARPRRVAGGLVLLASVGLLLVGRAGAFVLAEGISLLLVLPGIVLFVWGSAHLKALALPLAYLQFMIPWTDEFINRLHWPLQLFAAAAGVSALDLLGYAALLERQFIVLPNITLEVARECSGILFLTSVLALGFPLVYLTQRTWARGVTILASGVVIAIGANAARVIIAALLAYHFGPEATHGPFHIFQGWFVAQVGFVGLFVVNWWVARYAAGSGPRLYERAAGEGRAGMAAEAGMSAGRGLALAGACLLAAGLSIQWLAAPRYVPPGPDLQGFPAVVGGWSGEDSAWMKGEQFFPGADAELVRTYRAGPDRRVDLYIGYFGVQRQGKALVNFHARPLHDGAREAEAPIGPAGTQRVSLSRVKIGDVPYTALFWYRYPGRDVAGRYPAKLVGMLNAVVWRRNNGAVILLAVPSGGRNGEDPLRDLQDFARAAGPLLRGLVP